MSLRLQSRHWRRHPTDRQTLTSTLRLSCVHMPPRQKWRGGFVCLKPWLLLKPRFICRRNSKHYLAFCLELMLQFKRGFNYRRRFTKITANRSTSWHAVRPSFLGEFGYLISLGSLLSQIRLAGATGARSVYVSEGCAAKGCLFEVSL